MRLLKVFAITSGVWVLIALAATGAMRVFQPQPESTVILRTHESGVVHEAVVQLHNFDGELWIASGNWFRGWYNRLLDNPEISLAYPDGTSTSHIAVPVTTPEARRRIESSLGRGKNMVFWVERGIFLFPPLKPVRLDQK